MSNDNETTLDKAKALLRSYWPFLVIVGGVVLVGLILYPMITLWAVGAGSSVGVGVEYITQRKRARDEIEQAEELRQKNLQANRQLEQQKLQQIQKEEKTSVAVAEQKAATQSPDDLRREVLRGLDE